MAALEILDLNDAFVGEIAESGNWVVANLETSISWPVRYQKHEFCGKTYFIIPLTKNHYPAIAVKRSHEKLHELRSNLLRFLSAVSWSQSAGAIVVSFTGGGLPRPMGRESIFGQSISSDLNLAYLPRANDKRQALALALMREGRGLNHPAYAFLSFYRVLEAAMPNGKVREAWVAENLDAISDHGGKEALASLRELGIEDVGEHLYMSGRMAIAHASSDPIVNPDDASDYDRIASELPLMRGLAELAIECVLGIKTRHTAYREHLYELSGFKDQIGEQLLASISAGKLPVEGDQISLPRIDVELRLKEHFPCLRGMHPVHASQEGQCVQLVYRSDDELVDISFTLDFTDERLIFDWQSDIYGRDDGSREAALHAAALTRFVLEYVGNGELHIFDNDSRALLSRKDAFIPINYWADQERLIKQINDWNIEAERRSSASEE